MSRVWKAFVLLSAGTLICSAIANWGSASVLGPGKAPMQSAIDLVAEYTRRDGDGERLETNPWFLGVVSWEDEPAYDSYAVIRAVALGAAAVKADTVRVPAVYERLGWVETSGRGTARLIVKPGQETRVFVVVRMEGRWIITDPQTEPHVLATIALARSPLDAGSRATLMGLMAGSRR
jgi:hypothetical protein